MNLHKISFILLIIGGLNWGLVLFGSGVEGLVGSSVANVIYALVALAAIYEVVCHKGMCKACDSRGGSMGM